MSGGMERAMSFGREMIEQVWEKMKPEELPKLRKAPKGKILVVKGNYDHVEKILENARVPFTLLDSLPKSDTLGEGGRYQGSRVLFVNCDRNYHQRGNYGFDARSLTERSGKGVTDLVERGGRIITTDWAQAVVRYLFGKISAKEEALPEEVVIVNFENKMAKGLSGIWYGDVYPRWWIEPCSDTVSFEKNSGVIELITSEELMEKYNSRNIAIAFKQGEGEVFHFVSHLIAQKLGNYDEGEQKSLQTFIDRTGAAIRDTKNLGLGQIETTYTLMSTVLELCRDRRIL